MEAEKVGTFETHKAQEEGNARHWRLLPFIIVLGIGSGLPFGFQISVTSSSSVFVKDFINQTWIRRYGTYVPEATLTLLWSTSVSIYSVGGLLGSLLSAHLSGKYGKRKCQTFCNLLGITSALCLGFSKMAGSYEMILVGRFLYGFTLGLLLNIYIQYLGEISPRCLRGFINTTAPIFATSGKLWGQIVGLREVLGTEELWPLMLSITGFTKIVQLVVMPFYPETPPYLLLVKRDKERCIRAMEQFWGEGDYQTELDDMLKEQEVSKKTRNMSILELVRDPSMRWQLYTIYYYANSVFITAGLPMDQIPYITLGMGCCEVLAAILCSLVIERFGRKVILLGSYGCMAVMLSLLTVTLSLQGWYDWIPYCSAVLIFLFIFFFGVGPGPVTITIVIEMCSRSARAAVFVIISSLNWVGLYLIGVTFPYVVASLGHFCFLIFLTCIVASGIFMFFFLPETKGKSLQQITEEFNRLNYKGKHSNNTETIPENLVVADVSL